MKNCIATLHILLTSISLFAGATALWSQSASPHSQPVNWSLRLSSHHDSIPSTHFNLGLLSNIGSLNGWGFNLVSGIVQNDVKGMQMASILSFTSGNANGVQIGGLANIVHHEARGIMLSGLMNASSGPSAGLQFSGISNISGETFSGLQLGGLLNFSNGKLNGLQLSSIMNASSHCLKGSQIALISNIATQAYGLQASIISNISSQQFSGLQLGGVGNVALNADGAVQISSLSNVCLGHLRGMQFSLANYTQHLSGVQLGILNLSTGKVNGWQIGLINHSRDTTSHKMGLVNIQPNTRIQPLLYFGNANKINLAVRFRNRINYSIIGLGSHYLDLNNKFSGSLFYRTGLYRPLGRLFDISTDVGYFHIENFENETADIPQRMYSVQFRVNLECKVNRRASLFISTGYAMTRHYHHNTLFDREALIEGGIVLF